MAETSIEWTDKVWNPLRGCTRISPGCQNCYAERMAARFSGPGAPYEGLARMTEHGPRWTGKVKPVPEKLMEPLQWRKPARIFVNSMSDLFHEDVPEEYVDQVFGVMAMTPHHTYQVLTKRPERMAMYLDHPADVLISRFVTAAVQIVTGGIELQRRPISWPLPNVWLGTSVENQACADRRIPHLLNCPAAIHFLSCEPLLGPINLGTLAWVSLRVPVRGDWPFGHNISADAGVHPALVNAHGAVSAVVPGGPLGIKPAEIEWCRKIDWVITGGESGPGARPMHPDWVRSLRDQCQAADVPFFFKQWGMWRPPTPIERRFWYDFVDYGGKVGQCRMNDDGSWHQEPLGDRPAVLEHMGKKAAGGILDGQEWRQMPEAGADG